MSDSEIFNSGALADEPERPEPFLVRHRFGITLSLLVFSFFFILYWDDVVISLRAGQQGIYWSRFFGGTSDRILLDGTHLKFPWDEITIYDSRIGAATGKVPMLSKDGMQIEVEWIARYRPDPNRIPELHRILGPEYRDKVVIPDVVSSLRQIVGDFTAEEIYTQDEEPMLDLVETRLKPLIARHPILLERVQILRMSLPKDMAQGIVNKQLHKQEMLSFEYRIKAEESEAARKVIEAQGIREFEKVSGISILKWKGIAATTELSKSPNSKVIIMGAGANSLPVLLNADK
ncbi:MAG TPA: prohibitin family protein [Bryobacteraceae bacterium]|nr:prohibitin family protein [Bryobacteraceae bacterium]